MEKVNLYEKYKQGVEFEIWQYKTSSWSKNDVSKGVWENTTEYWINAIKAIKKGKFVYWCNKAYKRNRGFYFPEIHTKPQNFVRKYPISKIPTYCFDDLFYDDLSDERFDEENFNSEKECEQAKIKFIKDNYDFLTRNHCKSCYQFLRKQLDTKYDNQIDKLYRMFVDCTNGNYFPIDRSIDHSSQHLNIDKIFEILKNSSCYVFSCTWHNKEDWEEFRQINLKIEFKE